MYCFTFLENKQQSTVNHGGISVHNWIIIKEKEKEKETALIWCGKGSQWTKKKKKRKTQPLQ